ncbi:hypothetical protein [Microbulbifer halophilus]|uniref:Uncharacterized protein n=1 Tax=Microbulbifer halophilus TaxID=453963 RepID=A0ABW5EAJ3_9GAMM|nr:hypothetical protein [Microbulbifer halophilus]MCW8125697.1 hypothetical protein [Microbulbifer halophilus]
MPLHRIHREDHYLIFTIPTSEVLNKLGRKYPFHIKRGPDSYTQVWKEPLEIVFKAGDDSRGESVPDLQVMNGRIFFSQKAFDLIGSSLSQDGEFLPITYDGKTGYIFNPHVIAEDHDALDDKVTIKNDYGDLQNLGFIEEKLPAGTQVFRTKADSYHGVFCTELFKQDVERSGLVGIFFQPDLANLFGGSASTRN